ncbi:hypothetical protein IEQ34_012885 [Dendrobium chrysotoxum]|uniref:Uncharacterized protein n=1 Tax=Dendrobium chrysotoxum TaxID=161865 RepID=A0AAV7GN12_DENCH|nr:hypothetical protein IEQ34_012885 [Dendrobium chrysotoxum]
MSSKLGRMRAARMGTKGESDRKETAARQRGQVGWDRSQTSIHSIWKACPHIGRVRSHSPSSNSNRQTAQSRFVEIGCFALDLEKRERGSVLMAASSRP